MSATWRLVLRAVLTGLTTLLIQLQQSSGWDTAVVEAAIVAGVLASLEALTPLNALVGLGKKPEAKP